MWEKLLTLKESTLTVNIRQFLGEGKSSNFTKVNSAKHEIINYL